MQPVDWLASPVLPCGDGMYVDVCSIHRLLSGQLHCETLNMSGLEANNFYSETSVHSAASVNTSIMKVILYTSEKCIIKRYPSVDH